MGRPRLMEERVSLCTYVDRRVADLFKEKCREVGLKPSELLRSFVESFVEGSRELRVQRPSLTVNVVFSKTEQERLKLSEGYDK